MYLGSVIPSSDSRGRRITESLRQAKAWVREWERALDDCAQQWPDFVPDPLLLPVSPYVRQECGSDLDEDGICELCIDPRDLSPGLNCTRDQCPERAEVPYIRVSDFPYVIYDKNPGDGCPPSE